ncbi:hypothetical protein AB205_0192610 [Aquarana catesbeiana]|uniref:Uncharacterized protein n=1 Tax=Aquarana catesbeiana TaxID=8400 RepID=A0A2G9RIE8_AQUCT|nr:hypothetical protein AB205_0192610 [Aquarana catesbeiana]
MELEEPSKTIISADVGAGVRGEELCPSAVPELLRALWEEPEKQKRNFGGRVKSHRQHRYRMCPLGRESYALKKLREAANGNDIDTDLLSFWLPLCDVRVPSVDYLGP